MYAMVNFFLSFARLQFHGDATIKPDNKHRRFFLHINERAGQPTLPLRRKTPSIDKRTRNSCIGTAMPKGSTTIIIYERHCTVEGSNKKKKFLTMDLAQFHSNRSRLILGAFDLISFVSTFNNSAEIFLLWWLLLLLLLFLPHMSDSLYVSGVLKLLSISRAFSLPFESCEGM